MHELCLERGESLRPLVELPNGCPSVDTFERVLQRIEPQSLYACLQVYGKELISDLEGKHIAIDGKRLRGSKKKTGSTHILSAWVDEVGLSLAQETVAEKHNELQAIPEVLDSLDLSGAVISIDAMGTQTNIAEQIIQSEADYILSLKGNQKHLYEDVQDCFTGQYRSHSLSLGISASPSLEQLGGRIDLVDFGYLLHKNIGLSAKVGASVYEVSSVSINGVPQYDDARLILGRVLAGGLFSFSTGKHGRIELKPMIGLGWASVTKVATSSAMFAWEAGAQYRLHLGRSTDLMTGLSYSGLGEFTDFALTLGFAFRRPLHGILPLLG